MTKKVICYLKDIMHLDLIYIGHHKDEEKTKTPIIFSLFRQIIYRDNSYVGNSKNKKSIMRYYYFINKVVIFLCSKKQKIVLMSTIEAKQIVFKHAAYKAI